MSNMTCHDAQQVIQQLLDQHQAQSMPPAVAEHLQSCSTCRPWQALLVYHPTKMIPGEIRPDFAQQTIQRYQQERGRQRWLRGGMFLALAASLFIAGMVWFTSQPAITNPSPVNRQELAQVKSRELLKSMRQEFAALQQQASQLQAPSWSIPGTLPEFELIDYSDAIAISMPAIRTIGHSLQGAMEPYEMPAKAAYTKVKAVMDDPTVKKWVNRFNRPSA